MTIDTNELPGITAVIEELASRGARNIDHPGGTLLGHLRRVHALLGDWGARPAVRLAGLCHAFYGTAGFPTALGEVSRRAELAGLIGDEAERIVYLYASLDSDFASRLGEEGAAFADRFTGAVHHPSLWLRQDLAEITVANELDIVQVNPGFRARHGQRLLDRFTSWRGLLSDPARENLTRVLP
jgi:hypothetical protein